MAGLRPCRRATGRRSVPRCRDQPVAKDNHRTVHNHGQMYSLEVVFEPGEDPVGTNTADILFAGQRAGRPAGASDWYERMRQVCAA